MSGVSRQLPETLCVRSVLFFTPSSSHLSLPETRRRFHTSVAEEEFATFTFQIKMPGRKIITEGPTFLAQ